MTGKQWCWGVMREGVQKTKRRSLATFLSSSAFFAPTSISTISETSSFFVTARVITPAGLAFNNEEEEEEGLLPPALPEVPAYKK
jgi:hypothetical protein